MFGQNPIRKIDQDPADGKLAVQEVFYTIQGEGPYAGCPAIFIRLAGCHLACTFCDTEFESGINNRLTVDEVVHMAVMALPGLSRADSTRRPIVVMTGGEPMRQTTGPLVTQLLASGFELVQFETAGNLWDPSLDEHFRWGALSAVELVVSPKTAHTHPMIHKHARHWKYIVRAGDADADDGLPITPTQKNQPARTRLFRPWDVAEGRSRGNSDTIWVSPCDEHDVTLNGRNLKHATALCLKFGYRLSLQTHKIIGVA